MAACKMRTYAILACASALQHALTHHCRPRRRHALSTATMSASNLPRLRSTGANSVEPRNHDLPPCDAACLTVVGT